MRHVHPVDPTRSGPAAAPTRRRGRRTALVVPVAALSLLLAACGSGTDEPAKGAPTSPTRSEGQQRPAAGRGGGGVVGEVAAVDGTTMQVRGEDAQTAVTWSDATTFTQVADAGLADVVPGVCVQAFAVPTGDDEDAGAAVSVAISEAVDGACTAGFGGLGGGVPLPPGGGEDGWPDLPEGERPEGLPDGAPTDLPEGAPTGRPDGAPTDLPEGAAPWAGGGGPGTVGVVSAVDGTTITVDVTSPDGSSSTATVTVDDATAYTRTVTADASAVAVGRCVVAQGEADDSGAVAATSVTLSTPGDDGCSAAGGGRWPGGPGGPAGADGRGADDDA